MPTVMTFAQACDAVYALKPELPGYDLVGFDPSTSGFYGAFQAAAFQNQSELIVCFKGTTPSRAGDIVADIKLGMGSNTTHFARGGAFLERLDTAGRNVTLCGHSLGGAIAQIVGNRYRKPFITFNAPGVAIMSRNIGEMMTSPLVGVRILGTVGSVVRHPVQAWQDASSLGYSVKGVNFRLGKDVVGIIGVHYGKVLEIPYGGGALDIGAKHMMTTVLTALETSVYRNRDVNSFY